MSPAKHTPGPWCIDRHSESAGLLIKPPGGRVVCEIDPLPEAEDNAALIAAAPDLLEALKDELRIAELEVELLKERVLQGMDELKSFGSASWKRAERIRAAIAKAEGGIK